jgi:hypothetical protein
MTFHMRHSSGTISINTGVWIPMNATWYEYHARALTRVAKAAMARLLDCLSYGGLDTEYLISWK